MPRTPKTTAKEPEVTDTIGAEHHGVVPKTLAGFLEHNTLALVLLFILVSVMVVAETTVTAFGFEFGFKSNSVEDCTPKTTPSAGK